MDEEQDEEHYFECIRGQAPDSEGGGVILKGLEGFRGGIQRIRKFDQF